ncbi:hypothetical protein SISNIDRAFT_489402 [Sistotremastrum niveocremeum HHB9708]|uniref:Uncharacterized protein n=1 Tax=Sistotremastrum niveocremeum HHB9708 TaxID=1314777 RepID=A0A164PZK4_9AGAM|nr:hypothetical protein SISNIDRAFT_489402 [Sistotremastrum niveocremeum HHB9708]
MAQHNHTHDLNLCPSCGQHFEYRDTEGLCPKCKKLAAVPKDSNEYKLLLELLQCIGCGVGYQFLKTHQQSFLYK